MNNFYFLKIAALSCLPALSIGTTWANPIEIDSEGTPDIVFSSIPPFYDIACSSGTGQTLQFEISNNRATGIHVGKLDIAVGANDTAGDNVSISIESTGTCPGTAPNTPDCNCIGATGTSTTGDISALYGVDLPAYQSCTFNVNVAETNLATYCQQHIGATQNVERTLNLQVNTLEKEISVDVSTQVSTLGSSEPFVLLGDTLWNGDVNSTTPGALGPISVLGNIGTNNSTATNPFDGTYSLGTGYYYYDNSTLEEGNAWSDFETAFANFLTVGGCGTLSTLTACNIGYPTNNMQGTSPDFTTTLTPGIYLLQSKDATDATILVDNILNLNGDGLYIFYLSNYDATSTPTGGCQNHDSVPVSCNLQFQPNLVVNLNNGAKAENIWWIVPDANSTVTIDTSTDMVGNILSQGPITVLQDTNPAFYYARLFSNYVVTGTPTAPVLASITLSGGSFQLPSLLSSLASVSVEEAIEE